MECKFSCPNFQEQAEVIPHGELRENFLNAVKEELLWCTTYAQRAMSPLVSFHEIRETQRQLILEFTVTDLAKEVKNEYNWHGQNTSQWVYAGAVVYNRETGNVSTHH